ncbi:D-alanyl-D-alanine carboxypeptidase family protein [Sphingomonas yabuuchiae]|uniref:D-alanyl-D-alanine carboxypeptidase family protein n=1 Tax=Sphingomonas yabuuchiae TaxID=172044 RepID=A0AA41DDR0_9SPHN|nr:D-alanyl-D-alanine carboxypeptidase family protein [Sphingomonas yabuuchiae]MBN3556887.1 D-alanyl-D-alanine carboxypeptidase family protein [Sphingomonas yabuuchiae]
MANRTTRELYLQVGGNVAGLQTASKAGKSALLEIGSAAADVQAAVEKAFSDMASNAPSAAKALERSYNQTFAAIRANAQAALSSPSDIGALQILDAGAADRAADAAEKQAAALRQVATAAAQVAQRAGEAGEAERVLAVAAAANAQQAETEAAALRNQANILNSVSSELMGMGNAHRVVTTRNEQQRQSTIMLGQQLQDFSVQVVSGQSVATAFAQQIGQAAFAVQGMGGKLEGVANFLTSGWGIAATIALTVLAPLVAKVIEHGDALADESEKLKKNAETAALAESAKKAFATTEAGIIDDVRTLTAELEKQNQALLTNAERMNIRAKKDVENLYDRRAQTMDELAEARKRLGGQQFAGGSATGAAVQSQRASENIRTLQARLKEIDRALADAEAARLSTQKDLAGEAAKRAVDPLEQIRRKYEGPNGLIEQAKKQATAEETVNGVLTRRLTLLAKQQRDETAAEQKRQSNARATPNNNQIGRSIDVAEATRIAASIGGRVTSGLRSTERQAQLYADKLAGRHAGPVAKPGTSDHERGQAIDIAYGPGISVSSIRKAFAKEGVAIRQLLDEKEQRVYHVAFGPKGKSQETINRQAEAAEQKRARDAEAYAQLKLRADEEAVQLRRSQVVDIAAAADLDAQAVEIERQRLASAADAGVTQKRWSQAQAEALKAVYASNAAAKTTAIRDAEAQRLLDQQLGAERDQLQNASALLQIQGDLATTNAERKRIALELLANDEKLQRAQAVRLIGSTNPDDWARGESMLRQIDAERPGKTEQINRQFADPLETYRRQLQQAAGDMDTALQGVAVRGFQSLEDGLVGLIDGTENVAGAFKRMAASILADLARIAIQKAILSALPGVGKFLGFAEGGEVKGHAAGGLITGPGTGTSDDILSWLSNGEFVMTAAATRRYLPMLKAMNDNKLPAFANGGPVGNVVALPSVNGAYRDVAAARRQRMAVDVHAKVEASPEFDVRMQSVAARTVGAAAEPIMAGSEARTIRRLQRADLPGGAG